MLNGHPGEEMPPLRVLDPAVAAGVLAHVQTLPGIDPAAALSRGGRLYDNWALEIGGSLPSLPRRPYAAERGFAMGVEAKWRCVECHGWDYGGQGAIKGIVAMAGAELEAIVAILADRDHGYGALLGERDQADLARFVSQGQIDMDRFISRTSGKARGEAGPYAVYYRTICARCHGSEGMKIRTMPTLGEIATQNPWETLHKILNGHAAEDMPSLRALAEPIVAGILAYTQTLPRGGLASSLGRGGRLYDNWSKETKVPVPNRSHSAYPRSARYANKPSSNWRCKECHGWDYLGKDGAYGQGRHHTGIKGIAGAAGSDAERLIALLQDQTHGFGSLLDESDVRDLANFISRGQIDMDTYIDRKSKKAKADPVRFKGYYVTICAGCHGTDGAKNLTMSPLGRTARVNPWEVLHKILNGPPGDSQYHSENADENMPGLRILDMDIVVGIIAYLQTLPADVVVHSY
jgi:mono/diheme cytochrome c family protein